MIKNFDKIIAGIKDMYLPYTDFVRFMEDIHDTLDSFGDTNKVAELEKTVTELEEKNKQLEELEDIKHRVKLLEDNRPSWEDVIKNKKKDQ